MNVIVFGASGGIGRAVVPRLLEAGHGVTAFVRETSDRTALDATDARIVTGDALDRKSVDAAFEGQDFDAVVCSVGSLPGQKHTDLETNSNIVDAAVAAGVRRFVGVSADNIYRGNRGLDQRPLTKRRASGYIKPPQEA